MHRRFPFNREISGIKHPYHEVTLSQLSGQSSNKTTEEWKGELLCSQDCSALTYNAFYMAYYKAQRNTIEFSWLTRVCLECYLFLSEDWLIFLVMLVWSLLAFKSNLYIQKVFPLLFTFPSNTSWFSTQTSYFSPVIILASKHIWYGCTLAVWYCRIPKMLHYNCRYICHCTVGIFLQILLGQHINNLWEQLQLDI